MTQITYTLRDLAKLVDDRERDIAPGSETGLLRQFVAEHDYTQTLIDTDAGDAPISTIFNQEVRRAKN